MDRVLYGLKVNLTELQDIIDKESILPSENICNGDRLKLVTINEYVVQALLHARNLAT